MMKLLLGTHTEVKEFLVDYLEGALPLLKRWQFRLHLALCPSCGAYLKRYNSSVALAQAYLDDPPPEELVTLTLRFLDRETGSEKPDPDPSAPGSD